MQHMAKNVVAVNEGKTRFMVSPQSENGTLHSVSIVLI